MRKLWAICLLMACMVAFAGCMGPSGDTSSQMSGEEIGRTVKQNFNTTAQITMKDISCTAQLEKGMTVIVDRIEGVKVVVHAA